MRTRHRLATLMLLSACTGTVRPIGVGEPLVVEGGTLIRAPMPGGPGAAGPNVTALDSAGGLWQRGQLGRRLSGRTDERAFAVAVAFPDLGSGHWTHPVEGVDPVFPGERGFALALNIGGGVPSGIHRLRLSAVDEAGQFGEWSEIEICIVDPRVPDNALACDPSSTPPNLVINLSWDADVDLDLIVETPSGKRIDSAHPSSASVEGGGTLPQDVVRDPSTGRLDGDSLAECLPDGRNSESVVWQGPPEPGLYLVYANLYSACGHSGAHFTVTSYRSELDQEGAVRLVRSEQSAGYVLGASANGGVGAPLYVTSAFVP